MEAIEGRRFGNYVVISETGDGRRGYCLVRCDCGTTKSVYRYTLLYGSARSCGCYTGVFAKPNLRHGMTNTPTHRSWQAMRLRCSRPKDRCFHLYGGRGIRVCERWETFENFYADMGERPNGTTLDRIDSDGNYEPGNCRWATIGAQNRNKRTTILNPVAVILMRQMWIRRKSGTQAHLAESFGVSRSTAQPICSGKGGTTALSDMLEEIDAHFDPTQRR